MTTPLFKSIKKHIQTHGPMTIADYMSLCLIHPKHGYYQQQKVFGSEGDFITAPEVSQIFGEMIGLYLVDRWQSLGCPSQFNLIETGPGRGTLMADILRISKNVAGFQAGLNLHLVEVSRDLRRRQKKALKDFGIKVNHHDDLKGIDATIPSLIIGNEFLDALPIHQFVKRDGVWLEKMVGLSDDENNLTYSLSNAGSQLFLADQKLRDSGKNDEVIEVCPAALSTVTDIDALLSNGGSCLLIDYGYVDHLIGDSFQAMKNHAYCDPLLEPGLADLTAHVNFKAIADAALEKGMSVTGPTDQGPFLMQLGAGQRAMQLVKGQEDTKHHEILCDLKRLTAPDQMGQLFKVIAIERSTLKQPIGFQS